MPFQSRQQARWAFAAQRRNEIPRGMAKRWANQTDFSRLPARVKPKRSSSSRLSVRPAGGYKRRVTRRS